MNFDSDSMPFVLDGSINCHMCNDKSYFVGLHTFSDTMKNAVGAIGKVGDNVTPSSFEKIDTE